MGKFKERAVKYFVVFMLLMLICTIVSRGIYAHQMPKVSTGTAEPHTLIHKIEAEGTILTTEEVPVVAEAGLLAEKVCVVEGQKVSPGDLLFQIELADLNKLMTDLDHQIQVEEKKLSDLQSSSNTAINRANQDLQDVADTTAGEVGRAQDELTGAQQALNQFPAEQDYKNAAMERDSEYQRLRKAAEKKKATKEEKEAFSIYRDSLDAALSAQYAQERKALEEAAAEKEKAVNAANTSRNEAIKQAQRGVEDAKNGTGEDAAAKQEQKNQINQLKEKREKLASLEGAEGRILCDMEGYVSRILIHAGERTMDTAALVISDAAGEKLFQAILPPEEKTYVSRGDTISLSFQNGKTRLGGVEVEALGELEDGSCQISAKISDPGVAIMERGKMEMNKDTGRYSCCVPLSAVYSDNGSDYVLLVKEKETILGTELTAEKRKVKVLGRDEEYVALEDGAVTEDEIFVVDSDKDIKDGARIRLKEE